MLAFDQEKRLAHEAYMFGVALAFMACFLGCCFKVCCHISLHGFFDS